ncbi:uncharacterized protein K452DRAFT_7973 [Aplosporella prunicola CBS 121167]|uniref:Uncharacterized protein n=1 Tax=Aplosporella prunicola CBS 121167 TaxID=1176127 RepID=A0A6A6BTR5_9PEZI|nr:uncharacterized protein K452DRAFT_7973 [Aplosporella prunicola CBS 121167]KAF2147476.1 hypothetical protein K452DRAFT_7973 [Aplosporella prunicola CBS 121167]
MRDYPCICSSVRLSIQFVHTTCIPQPRSNAPQTHARRKRQKRGTSRTALGASTAHQRALSMPSRPARSRAHTARARQHQPRRRRHRHRCRRRPTLDPAKLPPTNQPPHRRMHRSVRPTEALGRASVPRPRPPTAQKHGLGHRIGRQHGLGLGL